MNILVTGGAGYIGSFMVKRLLNEGYEVAVIDSLERGHRDAVDNRAKLFIGNVLDKQFLSAVFDKNNFDAVIHFAGYIAVGESVEKPEEYFKNNTFGSLCLLEQIRAHNVNRIIFSSTAGIYGNPQQTPITEEHPKNPESPYGESKLLVENCLSWYQKEFDISYVALRYFNAAGAALDGSMGEYHTIETHIIPNILNAILYDKEFQLYGIDYKTEDGTCIRDYIHVLDLVESHVLALKKLEQQIGGYIYNVGTGKGFTNKQVIATIEKVTGEQVKLEISNRRAGDADILIADNSKIKRELGFQPKYSDLETIIISAWKWHKNKFENKK